MQNSDDEEALGIFEVKDDMAAEFKAAPAGFDGVTGTAEARVH